MRPRPGGSPVAIYHPRDVERWLAAEVAEERPVVMPVETDMRFPGLGPTMTTTRPVAASVTPAIAASGVTSPEIFAELLGRAFANALTAVKPSDQIFRPDEAAVYAKRSVEELRELRRLGKLPNASSRPHRVLYRRADLDKL